MAYTVTNFKTKKALKEAVKEWNDVPDEHKQVLHSSNKAVRCFQPGLGPDLSDYSGKVYLEGPHYPEPHKWYAQVELVDGVVVKVS